MSYVVIARRWRPQTFYDLIGQEMVTQTLINSIQTSNVPHAMIFSGIRGVGKTSTARILAKSLNCKNGPTVTPCNECANCVEIKEYRSDDVYEIDAASHTGVEDVRQLIENIKYHPVKSLYKIYIIDEVHMLSNSAFNALLKTMEEPPDHVVFILATTETHKIPLTIKSRCMQLTFRKIPTPVIEGHLSKIIAEMGVETEDGSLSIIAGEADGSIRDAQTLLEQVLSFCGKQVSTEKVIDIMGVTGTRVLASLLNAVRDQKYKAILEIVNDIDNRGVDFTKFLSDFAAFIRDTIIVTTCPDQTDLVVNRSITVPDGESIAWDVTYLYGLFGKVLKTIDLLKISRLPRYLVEVSLIDMAKLEPVVPIGQLISQLQAGDTEIPTSQSAKTTSSNISMEKKTAELPTRVEVKAVENKLSEIQKPEVKPQQTESLSAPKSPLPPAPKAKSDLNSQSLEMFLQNVKLKDPFLGNALEQAVIDIDDKCLSLTYSQDSYSVGVLKDVERNKILQSLFQDFFHPHIKLNVSNKGGEVQSKEESFYQIKENKKQEKIALKKSSLEQHPIVKKIVELFDASIKDILVKTY